MSRHPARRVGGTRDITAGLWIVAVAATSVACADDEQAEDGSAGDHSSTDTSSATGESATSDADPSTGETSETSETGQTGDTGTGDTSTGDCEVPEYEDDIVLALDDAVELPEQIQRLAGNPERTLVCGHSFVATLWQHQLQGEAVDLPGDCAGLAFDGDAQVVAVNKTGHIALMSLDVARTGEGLSVLDTLDVEDASFHDVILHEGRAFVAAGPEGVRVYETEGGVLAETDVLPGALDARGLALTDHQLLVADGPTGVRLVDLDGSGALAAIPPTGLAQRVVVDGERALVLQGAAGFEVLEIGDAQLERLAKSPLDGMVLDASMRDGGAIVNTTAALVRYAIDDDGSLSEVSRERRPRSPELLRPWFMAMLHGDEGSLVAFGSNLLPFEVGPGDPAPDIRPNLGWGVILGDAGETAPMVATFRNGGTTDAILTGVTGDDALNVHIKEDELPPERPGCPGQYILEAGGFVQVRASYLIEDTEPRIAEMSVVTNDPDDPVSTTFALVNRTTPEVGVETPNLSAVTWEGDRFELDEHFGDVILVKLVAPG